MTQEVLTVEEIERIRRKLEDAVYSSQDEADLNSLCAAARRLASIEQEMRAQVLEEAARVVEGIRPPIGLHGYNDEAIRHIAAAIRALKCPRNNR